MGNELSKSVMDQIKADAKMRTGYDENADHKPYDKGMYHGFVSGAAIYTDKAQELIDEALHKERNAIQAKMTQMEAGYLKQIQCMADALEAFAESSCDYESVNFGKPVHSPECRACKARELVQQFKDGKGREVQKPEPPLLLNTCGICKERPIGSGITVCDECYKNFDGDRRGFWDSSNYH
ncbi:MAG TPA: hypothetical protein VF008_29150 [Niastella sp.]